MLAVGLALVIYWPVFVSDRLPGGELSDTIHQGYPFLSYTAASLAEGRIPHWNPYIYCGIPFYSSFSAPVFYPVRGLLLLAAGPEASVRFIYPIQAAIGAFSAWLLLGSIGVSRAGRLAGTVAFAAGAWANTLFYAGHASKVVSWSFLPLLLYSCEMWWRTRRPWFVCLGGICLGMQALASHPQMLLYSGIAAFVWLCWRFFERPGIRPAVAAATGLVSMAAICAALGAVQLLPGWNFSRVSTRGGDLPLSQSSSYSLPPEETLAMVFPHLFGYRHGFPDSEAGGGPVYWGRLGLRLSSEFVGVSMFLLALSAVFTRRRHGGAALGAIAVLGLLISWGGYTPFYEILYRAAPVFRKLRAPHMAAFLTTSGISLLAGPGFDCLAEAGRRHWKAFAAFAGLCVLLLILGRPLVSAAQESWWRRSGASATDYPELVDTRYGLASGDFLRAALAAAGTAAAAFLMSRGKLSPGYASIVMSGIALAELIPVDRDFQVYLPYSRISEMYPPAPALSEAAGEGRVFPGGNEFIPLGLRSVMGYHAARTSTADEMAASVSAGGLPEARSSGFSVLIDRGTPVPYGAIAASAFSSADSAGMEIPEALLHPMPRAFLATDWTPGERLEGAIPIPESLSTVSEDPGIPRSEGFTGTAAITADEPELVEISTVSARPALLVLADTWHPRWRVFVDGSETGMLRANGWMRAVPVPAGDHTVTFRYDSSDFRVGLYVTCTTAVLVICAGVFELVRRARRRQSTRAA